MMYPSISTSANVHSLMPVGVALLLFLATLSQAKSQPNQVLKPAKLDVTEAQRLFSLGDVFIDQRLDSAICYFQKSIHLARQQKDLLLVRRGYLKLARAYFKQADFVRSEATIQEGERLIGSGQIDSTQLEMQIAHSMNIRSLGDYPAALQLCLSLLNRYEHQARQWPSVLGRLYSEIGVIYDYLQDYDKAFSFHRKRLILLKNTANSNSKFTSLLNMGVISLNSKQLYQAEFYFDQALRVARHMKSSERVADVMANLGELAVGRGQYEKAIDYNRYSLKIYSQYGMKEHIGECLYNIATIYYHMYKYAQSLTYVDQSLMYFRAAQLDHYILKALELKSQILTQSGQYKLALLVTQRARQLNDSLVGLEKQKAIAQIQGRFELKQKQQQIETLNKNLTIQQQAQKTAQLKLDLAHQQQLLYLSSLLLLLLLIGGGGLAFYKQRRDRQRLEQQAKQLTKLNQTKDKLFSLISHDLRSPVWRFKQRIEFLRSRALPADLIRPIGQLEEQAEQLLGLLNNLLEWSHSQFNDLPIIQRPLNLAELVQDEIQILEDQLHRKSIRLINQTPDPEWVIGSPHQLRSVLRNLLGNAIKFTPDEGYIRVSSRQTHQYLELTIRDSGVGMSTQQLERLQTDPMVRKGTAGEPGTGLGLRLCRELLGNDPNALSIRSQPGQGTAVTIRLTPADRQESVHESTGRIE